MTGTWTLLALLLAVAACAGGPGRAADQPPSGDPYIVGQVTSVTPSTPITENCIDGSSVDPDTPVSSNDPPYCSTGDERPGNIVVEEMPDGDKAALTIAADTALWREAPGGIEPASFVDLAEGQTVAAYVSGPVMESFPVQATADAVVIRLE